MSNIVEFVKQQEQLFCGALTEQTVTWAKESQFAIQYFQKNDYLAKTALANPTSAQNAIINVAAIGITLNPASKLAYLVPRDGMVCLDISYMGLLHLAQSTGSIKWGNANWCTQTTPMNQTALIQHQPTNTTHLVSEVLLLVVIARLKQQMVTT